MRDDEKCPMVMKCLAGAPTCRTCRDAEAERVRATVARVYGCEPRQVAVLPHDFPDNLHLSRRAREAAKRHWN